MVADGCQHGLQPTNLGGMVAVNPAKEDFYRKVIEQRILHKRKNKSIADFLKVLANSGSYGLFVEVNIETNSKEKNVRYHSGEKSGVKFTNYVEKPGVKFTNYVEKPGAWYFPPLASLITSGGRLLLAMLEKCIQNLSGSYLFCDTDSMCIVGAKTQQLVPCDGGQFKLNGKHAVQTLTTNQVEAIAQRFNKLNPYITSIQIHANHIANCGAMPFLPSDTRSSPNLARIFQLRRPAATVWDTSLPRRNEALMEITQTTSRRHRIGFWRHGNTCSERNSSIWQKSRIG